jgi:polyhydroxybutyrate depolymerase
MVLATVVGVVGACADGDPFVDRSPTSEHAESSSTSPREPASSLAPQSSAMAATTATSPPPAVGSTAPTVTGTPAGATAGRPYDVYVPASYDGSAAVPLVVALHGYGSDGAAIEEYFELRAQAERLGFLYVSPDGTVDRAGRRFWNATDGCCNVDGLPVDDSGYLAAMIAEIAAVYRVDPARVYVMGLSNGGFMAYRMACDHAATIAAVVSFAGATYLDTARCVPSEPVNVLHVHGTADATIPYVGGRSRVDEFPSAPSTVTAWADYNGCAPQLVEMGLTVDVDAGIPGDDAEVSSFSGCPVDGAVELWTVVGAPHVYPLSADAVPRVLDFLWSHSDA